MGKGDKQRDNIQARKCKFEILHGDKKVGNMVRGYQGRQIFLCQWKELKTYNYF